MTVLELYTNGENKSDLRVLSGANGKVLCYKFNPTKGIYWQGDVCGGKHRRPWIYTRENIQIYRWSVYR